MWEALQVFWSQSWLSFKALYGWLQLEVYIMAKVITPVFQVVFFALVARFALGAGDVSFYVIGNAVHACYTSAFFGAAVMLRAERYFGTLAQVVGTPTSKFRIFAGRSLGYLLDSMLTVLVALAFGMAIFRLDLAQVNWPLFIGAIFVGVAAATAAGLMLGSFGLILTDVNLLLNCAAWVLLVFTGVNFPVEQLPVPFRALSLVLPLTRSLKAIRMAYAGGTAAEVAPLLGGEALLAVVYVLAGFVLFRWVERRARVDGTLDLY